MATIATDHSHQWHFPRCGIHHSFPSTSRTRHGICTSCGCCPPPPRSGVAHRHKLRVAVQFRARTLERSHFDIYKAWLETNPLQAIIAGDGGDDNKGGEDDGSSSSQRPTLSIKIKIQQNSIERTIQLSPSWVAL